MTLAAEIEVEASDSPVRDLRVALAHEWLVQYAGSERVVEQLLHLFPGSRLLTSLYDADKLPTSFASAEPSFLRHVPRGRAHHGWLLPLMPLAWRLRRRIEDADAVISSSHACAKAVRVKPTIPHICYCHTPMRYAWDFPGERRRFPPLARPAARAAMAFFRRWDRRTSDNVDLFVANSSAVAERVSRSYGRSATVVHPPVDTKFFTPGASREDFFLYVGRLVSYKSASVVVDAFAGLDERLVVVGSGHLAPELRRRATSNVSIVDHVDRETLRSLYRTTRALVYPADEDFGIAMAEAQACGTPIVALAKGGAIDIVAHGQTGWLIPRCDAEAVRRAVTTIRSREFDHSAIARSAQRFSAIRFRSEMAAIVAEAVERGPVAAGRGPA